VNGDSLFSVTCCNIRSQENQKHNNQEMETCISGISITTIILNGVLIILLLILVSDESRHQIFYPVHNGKQCKPSNSIEGMGKYC
jgi:hypothetical protein